MNMQELKNQLESLIDSNSLATVLQAVSEICHEKAQHLEENWQDKEQAKAWTKAGIKIDRLNAYAIEC